VRRHGARVIVVVVVVVVVVATAGGSATPRPPAVAVAVAVVVEIARIATMFGSARDGVGAVELVVMVAVAIRRRALHGCPHSVGHRASLLSPWSHGVQPEILDLGREKKEKGKFGTRPIVPPLVTVSTMTG